VDARAALGVVGTPSARTAAATLLDPEPRDVGEPRLPDDWSWHEVLVEEADEVDLELRSRAYLTSFDT